MEIAKLEINRRHLVLSLFAVIVATLLFVLSTLNPALNTLEPWALGLLTITRFILLGCALLLIVLLVLFRLGAPLPMVTQMENGTVNCGPCDRKSVWFLDETSKLVSTKSLWKQAPTLDLRKIRIVVIRINEVPGEFVTILKGLQSMVVLDLQGCISLPNGFWTELETCRELRYVLAAGLVHSEDLKLLHMTLPEAKFLLEPCRVILSGRPPIE